MARFLPLKGYKGRFSSFEDDKDLVHTPDIVVK